MIHLSIFLKNGIEQSNQLRTISIRHTLFPHPPEALSHRTVTPSNTPASQHTIPTGSPLHPNRTLRNTPPAPVVQITDSHEQASRSRTHRTSESGCQWTPAEDSQSPHTKNQDNFSVWRIMTLDESNPGGSGLNVSSVLSYPCDWNVAKVAISKSPVSRVLLTPPPTCITFLRSYFVG